MPSTCKFELNHQRATYFSGETVSGTIILNTTNEKNVRDVSIIFLGEGKVKWDESHSTRDSEGRSRRHVDHFRSNELYINNCKSVHGDGILPAGRHVYTFNIPLPLECPTSFEGKYGHIRYEIILKIKRSFRFDNIYKKALTIVKTIDLNLNSAYKQPAVAECVKSSCCWPCSRGNIFYTLKVPFRGYAPGQRLKYILHIDNQSMNDTYGYFFEFKKKVTFTAKTPHHKERTCKDILVDKAFAKQCLRLTTSIIEGEVLIPSTPPTSQRYNIISVEYKLKVVLQLSGCSSNMSLEVPIVIGTVPIRESLLAPSPNASTSLPPQVLATAPPAEYEEEEVAALMGSEGDLPPSYNEFKPPTFEEATRSSSPFIDTDIDERNRIIGFKPLYPMYRK